ncbi:hypothetical protein [Providencia alcalifaciens]|uniref:hypothetical protein n=1 Tax=Providencia alcalifaciens TaxID=126385 RepID=UPI00029C25AC|nr:hypothetical protein [Providencia alcalifaciens]EKT61800.1 type I pilus assembly protein FimE [Providencia alcalifaciens Dmel2]
MNKLYVFMSLCLYVFMPQSQAYTYTCTSDFTHQINLDSNSSIYPSQGAVYDITFDNKKQYNGICDVPNSGLTEKEVTYYKAEYGNDLIVDSDGYVVLNDFVKVKSYIYIYNQGDMLVPFSDVSNKAPEIPKPSTFVASGSSGRVDVLIQKSILQGTITIPEFNIYLYSRYAQYSDSYNTKPLSIVHFEESTLNVEKVCNIDNLPFNESILNQSLGGLLNNSNSLKNISFTISCINNISDLNLNLSFSGEPYKYDSRFFQSDVDSIGIGLYNGSYIYGHNGFPLSLSNGQATVSMQIVPVVQDKKTEINSTVNFNIRPIIYQ